MDLSKEVEALWEKNDRFLYHYHIENELVTEIFERYPKNDNLNNVIKKVSLLDAFYSTNLRMNSSVLAMAEHIVNLSAEKNLDRLIEEGSPEAVSLIRDLDGCRFTSFASKYCCNSNRADAYWIYDSIVADAVYEFFRDNADKYGRGYTRKSLGDYPTYCIALDKYKEINNLIGSRREVDWYIWGNEKLKKKQEENAR